jgi:hypothetical protein
MRGGEHPYRILKIYIKKQQSDPFWSNQYTLAAQAKLEQSWIISGSSSLLSTLMVQLVSYSHSSMMAMCRLYLAANQSNLVMTTVIFDYSDQTMAFTRVANWSLTERGQSRFHSRQSHASVSDLLFRLFGGSRPQMFVAALATLAVHVALLLFLIFRLSDVTVDTVKPGAGALTLIDLSKSDSQAPRTQPPSVQTSEPTASQDEEQPKDQLTASMVPEWTMVKIRVAHILQAITSSPTSSAAAPNASNSGAASGTGGGFDPYAGSAPQWRNGPPAAPVVKPAVTAPVRLVQLDPKLVARLRKAIEKTGAPIVGSFRLHMELDRDSKVVTVSFVNLSAGPTAQAAMTDLLRGKKLNRLINATGTASLQPTGSAVEALI